MFPLSSAGLLKLREAVCRFHKKSNDLSHFSANDIIVGPGTKELIFLLLNVFNGGIYMCMHGCILSHICLVNLHINDLTLLETSSVTSVPLELDYHIRLDYP